MPTQAALALVDAIALQAVSADSSSTGAVRAQAAYVRALVDEVERHHPSERRLASLHDQLGEELARLGALAAAAASDKGPAGGVQELDSKIEVLVVDDEDDAREVEVEVLQQLGYRTRVASSGEEALRLFDAHRPPIVLTDWSMPGMSGLELCIALKAREPKTYVILATGFGENARLLEGERAGADDFLPKPMDLEDLQARLLAASRLVRAVEAVSRLSERLKTAPSSARA
jgi:CheY-like chemotaxis protein